jgi:hypothetical protein
VGHRTDALEARPTVEQAREPPLLAFDHGVVVRAGPARLTLHGLVQGRFIAALGRNVEPILTADVHHAILSADGEAWGWLRARLAIDLGGFYFPGAPFAVRGGILRDAFVEVRPLPWLSLRGGQFAIPFGRQRLVPDGRLASVERDFATLAFTLDRDLGFAVEARPWDGRLEVQAAVTDGVNAGEPGARNDNVDFRYSARVVASPLGALPLDEGQPGGNGPFRFSFGGSALYDLVPTDDAANPDRDGNGRLDNVEVTSAAAELAASWQRLSGQAEYFWRREGYGALAPVPRREFQGAAARAQAVLWPGFLLIEAHFSWCEPHLLGSRLATGAAAPGPWQPPAGQGASEIDGQPASRDVSLGGSAVALWRSHDVKLQLSYAWHRREIPLGTLDLHLIELQASLAF